MVFDLVKFSSAKELQNGYSDKTQSPAPVATQWWAENGWNFSLGWTIQVFDDSLSVCFMNKSAHYA